MGRLTRSRTLTLVGTCPLPGDRSGIALVTVVLVTLAMTVLAHGLLTLADLEEGAGRAGIHVLRARVAAHAAVVDAIESGGLYVADSLPLWATTDTLSGTVRYPTVSSGPDGPFRDSVTRRGWLVRLSREVWLAEGVAEANGVARRAVSHPVWVLDPASRVASAPGLVATGDSSATELEGTVTGRLLDGPDVRPPGGCDHSIAAVDSLLGGRPVPRVARVAPADAAALGRLGLDELVARARVRVAGVGTPAPERRGSECDTGSAWNWGEPGEPGAPCSGHFVAVAGADGLLVEGGVGQGLLILEGDATLVDFDFFGVVVSGGRLHLEGDTHVTGLVRAAGPVSIGIDTRVEGSACWAAVALAHPSFRDPALLPRSGWIQGR